VTTLRFDLRSYITPYPKWTRLQLVRTYEKRSSITCFHQISNDPHFRKFTVSTTLRMRLIRSSPCSYGFSEQIALIFGTDEILIAKPKGTILSCRMSSGFAM
jgi:hypothetical protein